MPKIKVVPLSDTAHRKLQLASAKLGLPMRIITEDALNDYYKKRELTGWLLANMDILER